MQPESRANHSCVDTRRQSATDCYSPDGQSDSLSVDENERTDQECKVWRYKQNCEENKAETRNASLRKEVRGRCQLVIRIASLIRCNLPPDFQPTWQVRCRQLLYHGRID